MLWVTFDTPIDEEDKADVDFVQTQLDAAFPRLRTGTIVIISSQVPVGFTDSLRQRWRARDAKKEIIYCVSPENLRLGKALQSFRAEDRIVVGLDGEEGREHGEMMQLDVMREKRAHAGLLARHSFTRRTAAPARMP